MNTKNNCPEAFALQLESETCSVTLSAVPMMYPSTLQGSRDWKKKAVYRLLMLCGFVPKKGTLFPNWKIERNSLCK